MTDNLKMILNVIRSERKERMEPEKIKLSAGAQETIFQAQAALNVSREEAIELLLYYGSNPLYQEYK